MYELPEIEYWKLTIAGHFSGKKIEEVSVSDKTMRKQLNKMIEQLQHVIVWHVERRGLHIIFHLDDGRRFIMELNNETAVAILAKEAFEAATTNKKVKSVNIHTAHVVLQLQHIAVEQLQLVSVREAEQQFKAIGVDPLDRAFTLERMKHLLASKRSSIKTTLLDQSLIAGIGDKYVDEIAYTALLSPGNKMNELTEEQWEQLYNAMKVVLKRAVDYYIDLELPLHEPQMNLEQYTDHLRVYERDAETCVNCGESIIKKVIARKKTYICPVCQLAN